MKHIALLTCCLMSVAASADPTMCSDRSPQHADLLTSEQWQAVLDEKPDGDPVLEEAIAAEKAKYVDLQPTEVVTPIAITWEQARKLVLLGVVRRTFQGHNLTVQLLTRSGKMYVTKEPRIDEIWRVAHIVDPCGVYVQHVTE